MPTFAVIGSKTIVTSNRYARGMFWKDRKDMCCIGERRAFQIGEMYVSFSLNVFSGLDRIGNTASASYDVSSCNKICGRHYIGGKNVLVRRWSC